jgi:hypothetical protein
MPGEYLGDIEITDAFFQRLRNVNEHMTRINKVPRGRYAVYAESGNLVLELTNSARQENQAEKRYSGNGKRSEAPYPEKPATLATKSARAGK